jgi:hypothetical protein
MVGDDSEEVFCAQFFLQDFKGYMAFTRPAGRNRKIHQQAAQESSGFALE